MCAQSNEAAQRNINEEFPLALPKGTILAGQYTIDDVLGQGGFGITYVATDYKTGQKVAVKEFFPDSLAYREMTTVISYPGERTENYEYGKENFLQEAQTLAEFIGCENIVRIFSYFEENGTAYFVMEYIEGVSFDNYLKEKGGKISCDEAKNILVPVMEALAIVHSKGIVHRDVTPDNIYITSDGKVKLLDFGAARYSLGDKSKSLDVILKHGFAPKEQYTRRGKQGPFTDIYSLGATFYFAVTGRRPPDSIDRLEEDELIPPSSLGVKITSYQEEAILQALEVSPQSRYQSMLDFRNVLLNEAPAPQPATVTQQFFNAPPTPAAMSAQQIPYTAQQPYPAAQQQAYPALEQQSENVSKQLGEAAKQFGSAAVQLGGGVAKQLGHTAKQLGGNAAKHLSSAAKQLSEAAAKREAEEAAKREAAAKLEAAAAEVTVPQTEVQAVQDSETVNAENMPLVRSSRKKKLAVIIIAAVCCLVLAVLLMPKNVTDMAYSADMFTVDGRYTYTDGVYSGKWKNDMPHGYGTLAFNNGEVYEGEWKNGKANGKGTITYGDGRIYEGEFKDNRFNGKGKFTYAKGDEYDRASYEGEWEAGERSGKGVFKWINGDVHEGEYKDGRMNGYGVYKWADGRIYEGEFKDGKFNGQGKMIYADGAVYDGEWKDDQYNGKGVYKWADGDVHEGEFKDGLPNGYGVYKWSDGAVYEGEWKDGEKNGQGKYTYAKGDEKGRISYEGEWKDNKFDGQGKLIFDDGDIYEGRWKEGYFLD